MAKHSDHSPEESAALGARIDLAVRTIGTRAEAARVAGLTPQHIGQMIAGKTGSPSAIVLARLASASGLGLEWLVTGEGPMQREQSPPSAPARPIDHRFLGRLGDAIAKAHRSQGVELPVSELCQLAGEEYEKLAELELDEDGQIAVAKGLRAKWEKRLASESLTARKVGA